MTKAVNGEHRVDPHTYTGNSERNYRKSEASELQRQIASLLNVGDTHVSDNQATYLDFATRRCVNATCLFLRERAGLKDSEPLKIAGTLVGDLHIDITQTPRSLFIRMYTSKDARTAILTSCVEAIRPSNSADTENHQWMLTAVLCKDPIFTELSINRPISTQLKARIPREDMVLAIKK
jgi:hypothetical protein